MLPAVAAATFAYIGLGWPSLVRPGTTGAEGIGTFAPQPFAEHPPALIAWWAALAACMLCAAWTVRLVTGDLRHHRLPNRDLAVITLGTALPLSAAALLADQGGRVLGGVIGAAVLTGAMLLLWAATRARGRAAIGAGDVKLAPIVGFLPSWMLAGDPWDGTLSLIPALVLLSLCGSVIALVRRGRSAEFAFGPAMLAAMWFASFAWPWVRNGWGAPAG